MRDFLIGYLVALIGYEIGWLRTLRSYFAEASTERQPK